MRNTNRVRALPFDGAFISVRELCDRVRAARGYARDLLVVRLAPGRRPSADEPVLPPHHQLPRNAIVEVSRRPCCTPSTASAWGAFPPPPSYGRPRGRRT